KLEITIGTCKRGNKPGEFRNNYGVAVSADNEIFVTDYFNNRVQVFSINGTFLRLFPTVVPVNGYVVLYSRNGRPIKKFDVRFLDRNQHQYPVIAMDTRNNKVIVMDRDTIRLFHPNGTLYRSHVVFL
ncbi:PREDICTED: E3 ubiquitin-protein ligase TRIM71-like, partial [Branchiostoma belcheri]|uniref:E3 ubiquitin-protein ligase TRIM71-like n=1 Tax=Branchiostoma belcheri TaxID=7741 RepID=A0A6P4XT24_BRABE